MTAVRARSLVAWNPLALGLALLVAALGLTLAVLPLRLALAATLAPLAGLLLLARPGAGLALVALAVPFGTLVGVSVGGLEVDGADLAVLGAAAAWLAGGLVRKRLALRPDAVLWSAAGLTAVIVLSVLPAQSLPLVLKEAAKWLELLVVYLLARDLLQEGDRRLVVAALLGAASLQAALGLAQFATGSGPQGFRLLDRFSRAYGTFAQPNPFGGYLAFVLPLAFVLGLDRAAMRARPLLGLLALLTAAVAGSAILVSFSRSAWIAAAAGLLGVTALCSRRAALALGLGLAVLTTVAFLGSLNLLPAFFTARLGVALAYFGVVDLATVPVTDANFAVIERLAHWLAGYRMFADHPFLGVGAGNYPLAYPAYALPRWQDPLGHAHNVYLNFLAETGLAGLAAFLVFVLTASYTAALRARTGRGLARLLAWGALGALIALVVFNIFDNLFVHGMTALVGLVLGLPQGDHDSG